MREKNKNQSINQTMEKKPWKLGKNGVGKSSKRLEKT